MSSVRLDSWYAAYWAIYMCWQGHTVLAGNSIQVHTLHHHSTSGSSSQKTTLSVNNSACYVYGRGEYLAVKMWRSQSPVVSSFEELSVIQPGPPLMLLFPITKWCHSPQWWCSTAARVAHPLTSDTSAFTASGVLPVRLPSCILIFIRQGEISSCKEGKYTIAIFWESNSTVGCNCHQHSASCVVNPLAYYTLSNMQVTLSPA